MATAMILRALFLKGSHRAQGIIPTLYLRLKSNSRRDNDSVGSSTILLQDGLDIQELPIIVRQTNDVISIVQSNNKKVATSARADALSPHGTNTTEENAMVEGLHRCQSPSELYRILEVIPEAEVTPVVAANALHRLSQLSLNFSNFQVADSLDTSFIGSAILGRLCDTICRSPVAEVLLLGLKAAFGSSSSRMAPQECSRQLLNECLVRVSDNRFPVEGICSLVSLLHSVGDSQNIEKLWSGLREQASSIDETNIGQAFSVLPLLRTSRRVVLNVLEQRVYACWWKLTPAGVLSILNALWKIGYAPKRLCRSLTKWMSLNVHSLSERELCDMVEIFCKLQHHDDDIQKTLQRYMKVKAGRIEDAHLVAQVAKYCLQFRSRSPSILDALCVQFVASCGSWSPQHVTEVMRAVGTLNWDPPNGFEFFSALEDVLEVRFAQFRPEDVVEILLSCTYIGRFPLNFVRKVFNTYFLARLNSIKNPFELVKARNSLHLLDTAMTMECPAYNGPLLPKNTSAKSVVKDSRLSKLHADLQNVFTQVLGGEGRFTTCTTAHRVPLTDIYLIDFEILPDTSDNGPTGSSDTSRKAVIIHLPEHYCTDRHLIGPQASRVRHLRLLGYSVIQLDFDTLFRLRSQPSKLSEYIREKVSANEEIRL